MKNDVLLQILYTNEYTKQEVAVSNSTNSQELDELVEFFRGALLAIGFMNESIDRAFMTSCQIPFDEEES